MPDTAPSQMAYFVSSGPYYAREYLTVLNPNATGVVGTVSYAVAPLHGNSSQKSWRFPAHSWTTIDANSDAGYPGFLYGFWVTVDSNAPLLPILVERALYFAY